MSVDRSLIGRSTGSARVVVERAPVAVFAGSLCDDDPVYRDASAAAAAGFERQPVPPTFPFVMAYWGAYPEMQASAATDVDGDGAMAELFAPLLREGGLLLHGEQEFEYFAPVSVGDVLSGTGVVLDVYEKENPSSVMTFVVTETRWTNEETGETAVVARANTLVRVPKDT